MTYTYINIYGSHLIQKQPRSPYNPLII